MIWSFNHVLSLSVLMSLRLIAIPNAMESSSRWLPLLPRAYLMRPTISSVNLGNSSSSLAASSFAICVAPRLLLFSSLSCSLLLHQICRDVSRLAAVARGDDAVITLYPALACPCKCRVVSTVQVSALGPATVVDHRRCLVVDCLVLMSLC